MSEQKGYHLPFKTVEVQNGFSQQCLFAEN
jgi:hypothetical protein